jgi:mutator protein MutT
LQQNCGDSNGSGATEVVAGVIALTPEFLLLAERMDKTTGALVWEFPGGKVEPGETHAEALERELKEELGIVTQTGRWLYTSFIRNERPLNVSFYLVQIIHGIPIPIEHTSLKILRRAALDGHDFHDADWEFVRFLQRQDDRFLN